MEDWMDTHENTKSFPKEEIIIRIAIELHK